jgi:hypothetical protein
MVDSLQTFDLEAVWSDLIEQFSEPLSCLRELVQNAIDANSGEVEIDFDYESVRADGGGQGKMVLHVRDFGEGMDRDLIEGRLTELFSSGKDEDYTKIGRFGIGFVSVFALEPEVVCLDTGRSGEYWRVLFDGEGNFELLSLEHPVEGTHVRIVKPMSRADFTAMRGRSRDVVQYWCKHARIPVRVGGEDIREPFEVEAECTATYREEGTRIVAGLTESTSPSYGYYNRGLTLEEGEDGPFPFVTFKIDSRYLEHTLTRDRVVEDENFHKAHERLEDLIDRELPARLMEQLEEATGRPPSARHDRLVDLLARYLRRYGEPPGEWRKRPVVPAGGGGAMTIEELLAAAEEGRLMLYTGNRPVHGDQLGDQTRIAWAGGEGWGMHGLLLFLAERSVPAVRSEYVVPDIQPPSETPSMAAFFDEFQRLAGVLGIDIESVGFGRLYEKSPLANWLVLTADDFQKPLPADEMPDSERRSLERFGRLLINRDHSLVDDLMQVAEREPEWAAMAFLKMICRSELTPEEDARLASTVVRRRELRGTDDE